MTDANPQPKVNILQAFMAVLGGAHEDCGIKARHKVSLLKHLRECFIRNRNEMVSVKSSCIGLNDRLEEEVCGCRI